MPPLKSPSTAVIGLGRVGLITLFHLAGRGYKAYGFDINKKLISLLKNKKEPFLEPQFNKLLNKHFKKIQFLSQCPASDYYFICVPTPFQKGKMDLSFVRSALKKIKNKAHVFIRSTLSPGSLRQLSKEYPLLSLHYFPEFFREGCFAKDYKNNSFSVLGSSDPHILKIFSAFQFSKKTELCQTEEAEILKMAGNLFHGLKISFANEIGRIATRFKVSPQRIMDLFIQDKNLNISQKYLKPGFAYGGPCLSKDIKSLQALQKKPLAILPSAAENSNTIHLRWAVRQILSLKPKKIGILGCSFTGNPTDDIRESPVLKLAETLSSFKSLKLYGVEKSLKKHKALIFPKKSINQLKKCDMLILGGWTPFLKKTDWLLNYKGILLDLLIQDLPKKIKKLKTYTSLYSL